MTQSLQIHIYCFKKIDAASHGGKNAKSSNRLCDQANAQQYKDYQNIISCGTSCLDLWHNLTTSDREQSVLHQLLHVAFPFSQQICQLHRCQDSGKDLEKISYYLWSEGDYLTKRDSKLWIRGQRFHMAETTTDHLLKKNRVPTLCISSCCMVKWWEYGIQVYTGHGLESTVNRVRLGVKAFAIASLTFNMELVRALSKLRKIL